MTIWDGTNCAAAKQRLASLLQDKRADVRKQIRELRSFEKQLGEVQATMGEAETPERCVSDLGCCARS